MSRDTSWPQTQLGEVSLAAITGLTVTLDQRLCGLHLLVQVRVADDARGVANLATRFVEARNDAHNTALGHVREVSDLREWLRSADEQGVSAYHSTGPLVHDLDKTRLKLLAEVLERDVLAQLSILYLVRDGVDDVEALGNLGWNLWL